MLEGRDVPDYEALLTRESADPVFDELQFEYGSLEEVFNHATSVFGDHRIAARWPAVHAKTHTILVENWSRWCAVRASSIRRSRGRH